MKAILRMRIEKEGFDGDQFIDNGEPFGLLVTIVGVKLQLTYLQLGVKQYPPIIWPEYYCLTFRASTSSSIAQRLQYLNRTFKVSLRGEWDRCDIERP